MGMSKSELGEYRNARVKEISNARLKAVKTTGNRLWDRHDFDTISSRLANMRADAGINATSIYELEANPIPLLLAGSGGMSTGEFGLQICKDLDWPTVIDYVAIISNKASSNAVKLGEEYDIPVVVIDFAEWFRDHYPDINTEDPAAHTRLFFKEGQHVPPDDALEGRLKIRREYDAALADEIETALKDSEMPQGISLRGYSFAVTTALTNKFGFSFLEDTHPADLSFVNEESLRRSYPGFLADPTRNMLRDGHQTFRGSLIKIYPVDTVSDLHTIDAGELLALGHGLTPSDIDSEKWKAKKIQERMKFTEDFYLIALHATLLAGTQALANEPSDVAYRTWIREQEASDEFVSQKEVYVGAKKYSGKFAFGQYDGDCEAIKAI